MKFAIILIAIIAACAAVATVKADEPVIDPNGQPSGPMRAVTSCSDWHIFNDLSFIVLSGAGMLFTPRLFKRKKCWRTEFYGEGVTCRNQGKKGAEICEACR